MAPAPAANDNDDKNDDDQPVSIAQGRSRREKKDKYGRFAALAKLKEAKARGEKHKYDDTEEKQVYDVVDEDEYSEIVRQRQEDDWIVDDDGCGYVEDGREIFDDELDDDQFAEKNDKKKDGEKKKSKNPNIMKPGTKPKANIKSMFMAQAAATTKRKPEKDVSLKGDDLLGDLMEELHKGPADIPAPAPVKLTKKRPAPVSRSPHMPFSTASKQPATTIPSVKPIKPKLSVYNGEVLTAVPLRVKGLPKPKVKEEPMEESPDIQEFDSHEDMGSLDEKENIEVKEEQYDMDLQDINFEDEVDGEQSQQEIKQEVTSIKPEEEKFSSEEAVFTGWDSFQDTNQSEAPTDVHVDSSQLPLVSREDGEQILRFYWLDAYEDQYKNPGIVYLFGKVWVESAQTHVSCCVTVKNMERQLFVLPRKTRVCQKTGTDTGFEVTIRDVYEEFSKKVVDKYKIPKFKSKPSSKQYAFEIADVPVESDYLEVRYSADGPVLPSDLKGETFCHVFGTNTSSMYRADRSLYVEHAASGLPNPTHLEGEVQFIQAQDQQVLPHIVRECLEHLLIDRKMKGPSWLDIKFPQITSPPVSWCKLEVFVSSPDNISVCTDQKLTPPPLVVMSLNLRTVPNTKTHQNEIIGASGLVHNEFHMDKPAPKQVFQQHFCGISKPSDCIFPWDFNEKVQKESKKMKVEVLPTERALIGYLLARIHKVDPDLIVGHDIFGFDLDVLLHRINANKIPHWSKIGRLKRSVMPKLSSHPGRGSTFTEKSATCGRMICDIKISAKELVRFKSFDLTELTAQILKQTRFDLDFDQIRNMYSTSQHLLQLIEMMLVDSTHILKIMYELNVIPLALQITTICGNIMSRTLMGGRAERNEYLLLHAFNEKNFIVPDKEIYKKKMPVMEEDEEMDTTKSKAPSGRRKPAYAGGLVLEPKKGFYDKYILLLDFNSLYPSIIQEYNICFTTVNRTEVQESKQEDEDSLNIELPDPSLEPGILPTEIRKLVESRRQVKNLMKQDNLSPEQMMQYDIRQKALKLTANSMYGCLGFTFSRFYAKPLAALITLKGREILMKTKDLVQAMNLDVIYGDTDSIMVNSNCTDIEQVTKLGNKVKSEVNKLYKLLEIDIDGIYKSMLLLKKKKYAALSVHKTSDGKYTTQEEKKGLDIVRRDWSGLAKNVGDFAVTTILSGDSRESVVEKIHSHLIEVGEQVRDNKIPMEDYLITKQLTKNPEDYPDKKSLPHVQVALRLNSKGGKRLKGGDTVAYVVCEDGSTLPASQRAYHPEEVQKSETLKIDSKYYLAHQVHPVVSRLCDPIEGTDAAHIAECLGLDASGYLHSIQQENQDDDALLGGVQISDEEKYKDCERLEIQCPSSTCGRKIILESPFTGTDIYIECAIGKCPNTQCSTIPAESVNQISNQLTAAIRRHIKLYYQGWLKCEDTACGTRVQKLPLMFQRGHPICPICQRGILHQEYTDSMLYTQLCFYQYLFDVEAAMKHMQVKEKETATSILKESPDLRKAYSHLKRVADKWLRHSAYSEVNLNKLFEGLNTLK